VDVLCTAAVTGALNECKFQWQKDRQTDRVVLTMMSAGLGACRGHAVVPMYATEKRKQDALWESCSIPHYCGSTRLCHGLPRPIPCRILQSLSRVAYQHNYKVKQSYPCRSPWRPIGLWDVRDPTLSRRSAQIWWQGCQTYTPAELHSPETPFFLFCFWYSFP
jgi:hypothetical protein